MARDITKVFFSGRSQAVRIPKEFRFDSDEVFIERDGHRVILTPRPAAWADYVREHPTFDDSFPEDIEDTPPQEREPKPFE